MKTKDVRNLDYKCCNRNCYKNHCKRHWKRHNNADDATNLNPYDEPNCRYYTRVVGEAMRGKNYKRITE